MNTTKPFIPMKPYKIQEDDLDKLTYPVIVQPKFDGIRCIVNEHRVLSYTLKNIPNKYIRMELEKLNVGANKHRILDGELILMDPKATFQDVQSAVMCRGGRPAFFYNIFDSYYPEESKLDYIDRMHNLPYGNHVRVFETGVNLQYSKQQVLDAEQLCLKSGYEGIIIRAVKGKYKCGRSTLKEQSLLALKRFSDAEALVIGLNEMKHNNNDPTIDNHGNLKRSSDQHGKIGANTLGSLNVRGLNGKYTGKEFSVGSGFSALQRKLFWLKLNKGWRPIIKYKYFDAGSTDEAPRQPIFLGVRDALDL